MTIETKFKVNDLVLFKHSVDNSKLKYEIIFITSETCSAGTQVFYTCRGIVRDKDGYGNSAIYDFLPTEMRGREYTKFREDELKAYIEPQPVQP